MIVKHRRGTTKEWRENNIIPEAGELVIEECNDGTRRCKLGTGYQYFSDLPYIDDKLWEEIDSAKVDLNTKITNLDKRLSRELKEAKNSLKDQLDTEVDIRNKAIKKLTDDVIKVDTDLLNKIDTVKGELQKEIEAASEELQSSIDGLDTKINTGITGLKNQVANLDSVVTGKFINHTTLFDKKLDNAVDDIVEDYNTKITELTEELQVTSTELAELAAQADENKEVVADLVRDTFIKIDSVKAALKTQIAAQAERIDNLIAPSEGEPVTDINIIDTLNDLKVDHKGNRHGSAGTAVREAVGAVEEEVQELRDSLSQYIGTEAIDGLHYDLEGTVDPDRPYTLYLTANGKVIEDSGVQIISGAVGGPGSGSSTLKVSYVYPVGGALTVTDPEDAKLSFLFSGEDSSGDKLAQATAKWTVNGEVIHGIVKDGENTFDASKYVKENAKIDISLLVTDGSGSYTPKTWSIKYDVLKIDSNFNDKANYSVGEEIPFTYKVEGTLLKFAVFKLTGLDGKVEEIGRQRLEATVSGFDNGRGNATYSIPAYDNNGKLREHGSYLLEVYLEATTDTGDTITSKSRVVKDLIWYDATKADADPIIGVAPQHVTTKQYETTEIIYTVYDPKNINTPKVDIYVDTNDDPVASATIEPNKDYGYTPTGVYTYSSTEVGTHTIKIACGKTEKIITVVVDNLGVPIAPVTTNLVFDFHPVGIGNDDTEKRLWSYDAIHMRVLDNFDWKNGGYQIEKDENGNSIPGTEHFCIKAGSTAIIDYKLFADEAKNSGKEFKLVFKTRHVANPEAIFLSCIDNTTDKDHIGIQMGVHKANIYGKNNNLELEYSEEDIIEFEFNITGPDDTVKMVMGYEDGVPSRPMVYDSSYSFAQSDAKEITLGSPDCDLLIYRFKVYNRSLTAKEILDNFIADARTPEEMIARYNRNQIYANGKLTPESLAAACPWLRVYKLSAPYFTNNKGSKGTVSNTTIQQIYKDGDPILDNWICYNAKHSGQGTSSNDYGAAGRNLDFIMNTEGAYFELGDGTPASTITLTRESVPVAYLNAKVNIASSNNLTNALLANRYNRFNPYRRPFEDRYDADNKLIDPKFIKDTMEFHNCVIFIQETDPDLSTHREFADTDYHFYAIGNIGDSKKTDNTRATDPNDKYECCVEIMDVGLPLSDFPRETIREAMAFNIDTKTGDRIYKWATDKNLKKGILLEKDADGKYVPATGESVDVENKTYYIDFLANDDFSEDFTYGWRYLWKDGTEKENEEVFNHCKQKWINFYNFVTQSPDIGYTDEEGTYHEGFYTDLDKYFIVDSAVYYYLFTTRYCMVDNRAKNTFWHYAKTSDGSYKWDLCWDYDNDTALGLNNFGQQVYRYGLEDTDKDDNSVEIFRESDSTFFCRVRDLFADKLQEMFQTLENDNAWHAESFINECDAWQSEFPEELWHLDINRKYIRTYNSSFINGPSDKRFLTTMCNGKMKYHRRLWERNQEMYMASKYHTTRSLGDAYHAYFRVNRFDSTDGMAVTPNYQFTITPYSHVYLNVEYGGTKPIQVRANPNVETPVPFSGTLSADIIKVGSAAAIRDFGDLSALYPKWVKIANATRVKKLTVGTATNDYTNQTFETLDTGNNALLEEINLTNISGFDGTLNLADAENKKELINLKRFYALGTNLTSVLFADGGKLEYVELPAVNTIEFKNLRYLSSDNFKLNPDANGNNIYDSVVDLTIENCPLINAIELFDKCKNVQRVRLVGIDFGTTTYKEFIAKWGSKKGLTASGGNTDNAALDGIVKFASLSGAQFSDLRSRYPDLDINYDTLTSTITFKESYYDSVLDTDVENLLCEPIEVPGKANCPDPGYYGTDTNIPDGKIRPTKAATAEFEYHFIGWSIDKNIIVSSEDLTDELLNKYQVEVLACIEGDKVLYPVFEEIHRKYIVTFKQDNTFLFKLELPYGPVEDLTNEEGYKEPSKELYEFIGWTTSDGGTLTEITDNIECYASFSAIDVDDDGNPGYTINSNDITYDTFDFNYTMSITKCINKHNPAVYLPSIINVGGTEYTVTKLLGNNLQSAGCFSEYKNLLEITLPKSLEFIGLNAFYSCTNLKAITIPKNVNTIEDAAFSGCTGLRSISVANGNEKFSVANNCLMSTVYDGEGNSSKKILQAFINDSHPTIPQDSSVKSLGEYCFANLPILQVEIPGSIKRIASNAFSHCEQLIDVTLNEGLTTLGATCFAWCYALPTITLPQSLNTIESFALNSTKLTEITIPAAVTSIGIQAFGNIEELTTVTFNKADDGSIPMIEKDDSSIAVNAFVGSGKESKPITFNVPWSEADHMAKFASDGKDPKFGAKYCIFNYEYGKEAN